MLLEFGIKDIIDIILVALMLYYIYRLMRESRSVNAFNGIIVFVVLWLFVSQVLEMRLLGTILDKLVSVGILAVIIIFQEDIRKFLFNIGGHQRMRALKRFFVSSKQKDKDNKEIKQMIMPLVMASINMSRQKVGALIVFERSATLDDIVATGDRIDANINQRLIENIFFKNSPLHDGAVVIRDDQVIAAACILPLAEASGISRELGTRHRAAIGISENTDAAVIVVSEETGIVSLAADGALKRPLSTDDLKDFLSGYYRTKESALYSFLRNLIRKEGEEKKA